MKSADSENVQELLDTTLNEKEVTKMDNEETKIEKTMEEQLTEAQDALVKAEERIAELEAEVAKLNKEMSPEEDMGDEEVEMKKFLKSAPESVVKMIEAYRQEAELAKAAVLAKEEELADAEAVEKASVWKHLNLDAQQVGPALRQLAKQSPELAKAVEEMLHSVNAQAESANIFAEIGKSADYANGGSAFEKMTALAKRAVNDGVAPSIEQAMVKVAEQNPELYVEYITEKR